MNLLLINFIIALWAAFFTSLFLGTFVLLKGTKNVNKPFAFFSYAICWWSIFQILVITSDNKLSALVWMRIEKAGVFFIPTFFLHFTINFLKIRKRESLLRISYLLSFIFAILCSTKYMIADVTPRFYLKYFGVPGTAYHFAVVFLFLCVAYCLWRMFQEYRKTTGIRKNQIGFLCFACFLAYLGGGTNFLIIYNINVPSLLPFGTYAAAVYVAITAYAIIRHRLMDINIVIRKTAVYSIVATIITLAYFILIYVTEIVFRGFMGYKSIPWALGVIVLFTLIFQPLKDMVQVFVDRIFFKDSRALLQEELKRTQEELKRAERLKAVGTLAAGMAHEIKNPLTSIKTFAEYLPIKYNDPKFIEKFRKIVIPEVNKINDIVQQLLDFSKPKLSKLEHSDIHQIIDQTISFLNNDIIKYNINVVKQYDNQLPLLNIDRNQMRQVFLNLFLNSLDAMKQTGGKLTIATKLVSDEAEISISDTGTGISKKDLEHIFDPFYTTKETGTGLGMSIVYRIIQEHRGNITVESEKSVGTVVKMRLLVEN